MLTLPSAARQAGTYYGAALFVPPDATHVAIAADNRAGWTDVGVRETVVELTIELNVDGAWQVLGACTTDARPSYNREGVLQDATTLRCRLPRARVPQPQVRSVLRCASPCEGAVTLTFDDAPLPAQPVAEHHSVTYDNDGEAVATAATGVTIGAFAVGSNANRCMVVGVACWAAVAGDGVVASVSHNGSTTGWASVITHVDASNDRASIWRKVAPDVATATVVVTMTGACGELGANALSVYDVDQTTPIAGATSAEGTAEPVTVAVTAAADDLVYDAVYNYGTPGTTYLLGAGASQTARANSVIVNYPESGGARIAASTEPGAASVTMSWTDSAGTTTFWVQAACAIKATAVGHPAIRRHGGIRYGARRTTRGVF